MQKENTTQFPVVQLQDYLQTMGEEPNGIQWGIDFATKGQDKTVVAIITATNGTISKRSMYELQYPKYCKEDAKMIDKTIERLVTEINES